MSNEYYLYKMLFSKCILGCYVVNFLFFLGRAHNHVGGLVENHDYFVAGFTIKQFNSTVGQFLEVFHVPIYELQIHVTSLSPHTDESQFIVVCPYLCFSSLVDQNSKLTICHQLLLHGAQSA